MIDWNVLIGFEWDDGNSRKSLDKHDVTQAEAEQVFFNEPLLTVIDDKHSGKEMRVHALGYSDNKRLLHISFTLRQQNTKIRVISARTMSRKEREIYENQG